MSDFNKPTNVSTLDTAFGTRAMELMPTYKDIPDEFKKQHNPFVKWQQKWFFSGLKKEDIPKAKEGIDQNQALRHLAAIQNSFDPPHEHKEAGVAYLASLWFEPIT